MSKIVVLSHVLNSRVGNQSSVSNMGAPPLTYVPGLLEELHHITAAARHHIALSLGTGPGSSITRPEHELITTYPRYPTLPALRKMWGRAACQPKSAGVRFNK